MLNFCLSRRKLSSQILVSGVYFRFLAVVSFISILVAAFHVFPWLRPLVRNYQTAVSSNLISKCNVFEGRWVPDTGYPLYQIPQCPFVDPEFDCLSNGMKNKGYLNWRWKPKDCDIPRFNARKALEKLRGKRVVFVGDSVSRQQWGSLICMLFTGVEDKKSVYEINGRKNAKGIRFLGVLFSSFNLRIDYYRSIFLVQSDFVPKHAPKRVKSTIRLDKFDDISNEWIDSDILVFNSAHWWIESKLFNMGRYFQVGESVKLDMPISTAFRTALGTWASWVEAKINPNKTSVFFRTFETTHWSDQDRELCIVTEQPLSRTNGTEKSSFSDIIIDVAKKMKIPVNVLHVTSMGAFRSDAIVDIWSGVPFNHDCEHWCQPGVPDMWNEILLSYYNVT